MSTPDKCPHCGASEFKWIPDSLAQSCKCGYVRVQTSEGVWEAGATLQEWVADLNKCPHCGAEISELYSPEEGRIFRCGSSDDFTSTLCRERAAHAATKRELEMWKHNAGTAVTVAIERIQTQRDAAEARVRELETALENAKADASSWQAQSERFEKQFLEAAERVGELDGLPVWAIEPTDFGMARMMIEVPMPKKHVTARTLGEAMPRREDK